MNLINNEYEKKVSLIITTSRKPKDISRNISKVVNFSIPRSIRLNRGSSNLKDLKRICWQNECPRLAIIKTIKGKNSSKHIISFYLLDSKDYNEPIDITINKVNFPKKHDSSTRINISELDIQIDSSLSKRQESVFLETLEPMKTIKGKSSTNVGIINLFTNNEENYIGTILKKGKDMDREIMKFSIKGCRIDEND